MAVDYVMYAGDSKVLTIAIVDSDGVAVNVTGAQSVVYGIFARAGGAALVSKSVGGGVSIATSTVTVTLDPADTTNLDAGAYMHELQITDAAGAVYTALQGRVDILADYIA